MFLLLRGLENIYFISVSLCLADALHIYHVYYITQFHNDLETLYYCVLFICFPALTFVTSHVTHVSIIIIYFTKFSFYHLQLFSGISDGLLFTPLFILQHNCLGCLREFFLFL